MPSAVNRDCHALDSDNDGVNDCNDRCPQTFSGSIVGVDGCSVPICDIGFKGPNFDSGSKVLRPDAVVILSDVAASLVRSPTYRIEVAGHSDACGTPEANLRLSQQRAKVVVDYLLENGVRREQITAVEAYGATRPLVNPVQGCASETNRRVEFTSHDQ